MSTTVTVTELQEVLSDYKIHLTGYDASSATQEQSPPRVQNPPNWPTDHYRVPDYRPINKNLNFAERPQGANGFEFAFLTMMFTGVCLNATSAKIWGKTGGPLFPGLFRYAIGGEW